MSRSWVRAVDCARLDPFNALCGTVRACRVRRRGSTGQQRHAAEAAPHVPSTRRLGGQDGIVHIRRSKALTRFGLWQSVHLNFAVPYMTRFIATWHNVERTFHAYRDSQGYRHEVRSPSRRSMFAQIVVPGDGASMDRNEPSRWAMQRYRTAGSRAFWRRIAEDAVARGRSLL